MSRRIRITIDGVVGEATLDDAAAPTTVARFWDSLPIRDRLRHLRWGGEGAYILIRSLADASYPVENPVTFYPSASLAFRPQHGEFVIAYGQGQARSHQVAGAYATMIGTLSGNAETLMDLARATRAEGGKEILIERAGE